MAAQKIKDLAVKVGSYTDGQGQEKGRYQNVGSLMRSDDGNEFIVLHRWFNPAGVPNPENRDSVLISCFEPKQQQQQQQGWGQPSPAPQQQMQRQPPMNQQQPNPRQQHQQQQAQPQQQGSYNRQAQQPQSAPPVYNEPPTQFDDDIPF